MLDGNIAIVTGTVRCILDDGFDPPSVRRIQYHFGDLDGLLVAVVDTGFGELLATLEERKPETARLDVQERAAFVVNAVWQAFSSPTSRAALQILISTRVDADRRRERLHRGQNVDIGRTLLARSISA